MWIRRHEGLAQLYGWNPVVDVITEAMWDAAMRYAHDALRTEGCDMFYALALPNSPDLHTKLLGDGVVDLGPIVYYVPTQP